MSRFWHTAPKQSPSRCRADSLRVLNMHNKMLWVRITYIDAKVHNKVKAGYIFDLVSRTNSL